MTDYPALIARAQEHVMHVREVIRSNDGWKRSSEDPALVEELATALAQLVRERDMWRGSFDLTNDVKDQLHANYERQLEAAEQARDTLAQALREIAAKCRTVMVPAEYRQLLAWREVFLDGDEETPLLPPEPQLVCYAVADAMTLRELDAVMERPECVAALASLPPQAAPPPTERT